VHANGNFPVIGALFSWLCVR